MSHEWLDGLLMSCRHAWVMEPARHQRQETFVGRPSRACRFRHGRNGTPAPDGWSADGWQTGRLEGAAATGNAARCSYQQATEGSVRRAGVAARDRSTNRPEARGHWARTAKSGLRDIVRVVSGTGPAPGFAGERRPGSAVSVSVSFVTPPTGCSQRIAARRRAAWDLRAGDGGLLLGLNGIRFNVSASAPRA
jgi:hypothetical protein